jgi:hypothetical protein
MEQKLPHAWPLLRAAVLALNECSDRVATDFGAEVPRCGAGTPFEAIAGHPRSATDISFKKTEN